MQLNTNPKAKQKIKATATELRYLDQAITVAQAASGVALAVKDESLRAAADEASAALRCLRSKLQSMTEGK